MDTINGHIALKTAEDISHAGGTFTISFYRYSRSKKTASTSLKTYSNCRIRRPLPHEKFSIDGANFFLFETGGEPKMCYRVLVRFIGFPSDGFKLKRVIWYE